MTVTCPHTHKQYNAEPIAEYEINGIRSVAVLCYWCDSTGKFRWESDFNESSPQPHYYDLPKEKCR